MTADDSTDQPINHHLEPCLGVQQVHTDYKFLLGQGVTHQQAVELLTLTYGDFSKYGAFEIDDEDEEEDDEEEDEPYGPVPGNLEEMWNR